VNEPVGPEVVRDKISMCGKRSDVSGDYTKGNKGIPRERSLAQIPETALDEGWRRTEPAEKKRGI